MNQSLQNQFFQIAIRNFPEAKSRMKTEGIELSMSMLPAFMDLFTKVMNEAYELGRKDAQRKMT
ncbi:ComZ family protein [Bacillus testis]|uniref:ComZ family protein n=1 Tax=Bacillus testis TaxID=1622072 RepID=UPI00067ECC6A|nr:ComZ family protein [Bacillus testis]